MLLAFQAAYPDAYDALWLQLDQAALFGPDEESPECYLSSNEWRDRLLTTLAATLDCLALVQAHRLAPAVQIWVDRLEKILRDELALTRDADGRLTAARLLSEKERGKYRLCSATDPDATIRNHGDNKQEFGYNVSLAATTNFIREIRADAGSTPDTTPLPDLITAQFEHHDHCPEKLIFDQIAGTGKTAAAVTAASNGRTQLVAKPMPHESRKETFDPADFSLSDDESSLTCPNGRTSVSRYRSGSGDGFIFRFMPAQCVGCPLRALCREKPDLATKRDVYISDYLLAAARLKTYSQTEDFKLDMKLRPEIERIIAGLVLHNGARCARFRGQPKVDFQVKMQGTAYNLKRWVVLANGQHPKKRKRFGAPPPSRAVAG